MRSRTVAALCAASVIAITSGDASAQTPAVEPTAKPSSSMWHDEWPQFGALEGFLTSSAVLGMVLFEVAGGPAEPRWKGGILFDDEFRSAVRARDETTRRAAGKAGDAIYYTFPVIPIVVDSFVLSLLVRRDEKTALNLFLVSGEALAYSGLLSFVANSAAARERPDVTACLDAERRGGAPCEEQGQSDDFYSGHTAMVSASAGAVCANHVFMPLWGHPVADAVACGLASSAAIATAATRLVGDRHYFSDVFVGSVVGFGIGFAVPTLLHYRAPGTSTSIAAMPGGLGSGGGLKLIGEF
jgi:hypothetical protein